MIRKSFFMVVAAGITLGAACGTQRQTTAQEVGVPTGSRFASTEQCERAVESLERSEQASTSTPVGRKGFFNTTAYNELHRDRVRRCTTTLSEKEALCISEAPSLQYVRECRKFALVR